MTIPQFLSIFLLLSSLAYDVVTGICIRFTPSSTTVYADDDCTGYAQVVEYTYGGGGTGRGGGSDHGGGSGSGSGSGGGGWTSPGGLGASGPVIAQNIYSAVANIPRLYSSLGQEARNLAAFYNSMPRPYEKSIEQIKTNAAKAKERRGEETKEDSLRLMRHFDEKIRSRHETIMAELHAEHKTFEEIKVKMSEAKRKYEEASKARRAASKEEEKTQKAEARTRELNANGLLKGPSHEDDRLKSRKIGVPETRIYGQTIRKSINLAFFVKEKEIDSSKAFQDANLAIDLLLEADDLISKKGTPDLEIQGVRKLEQGARLAKYAAGEGSNDKLYHDSLSQEARVLWGLPATDGTSFEGAEIISVVNEAGTLIYEDELLHFHFASAIQQASADATYQDTRGVLNGVDRAWAVVNYAKGLSKGLAGFAYDTATGTAHLVIHPVDSAQAIYATVVNYDKTYTAIQKAVEQTWNQYDGYSPEEKGQLHSRIASEILSTVFPLGALGNAAKLAKLAKLEKVGVAVGGIVEGAINLEKIVAKAAKKNHNLFAQGGFIPPSGTRKFIKDIPDNWRIKPTNEPGGVKYVDPRNSGNSVRIMPGNSRSPYPNSCQPYVRWDKNGRALDVNGKFVPVRSLESHIPLEDFGFKAGLF